MTSSGEFTKQQRIDLAMQAYQKNEAEHGQLSLTWLARTHGISRTTLKARIDGRQSRQELAESVQLLKPEQEEALATYIKQMEAWGWPPRVNQVKFLAQELYTANHPQQPNFKIGINWVSKFLGRRTELTSIFSQAMDKERMAMHKEERLAGWFILFEKTVKTYKIEHQDIYNMDEKGFAMGVQSKMRVICSKNQRPLRTSDGNREWVSLIECVNILGDILKMWVIFKGKYQQKSWMETLDDGHITTSENGWTNNEIGLSWLAKCFEPETQKRQKGEYRLLIIDGHQSHLTSKAIEFAGNHKIIILCLPSHSTDLLQPLDVGIFGPVAQAYQNELERLTRLGIGYYVDKVDFLKMYQKARITAMTPEVIRSAWAKSGLSPLNPERVLEKLPSRNRRPKTPPEMTLTSSNGASWTVPFTPSNSVQVDILIDRIVEQGDKDAQVSKKLAKACTSAIANYQMLKVTNKGLVEAAEHQRQKSTRTKGHYGEARVMNQAFLEERANQIASKAASKAKERNNRQDLSHMNQVTKAFMRLDPVLFAERKESPKKKKVSDNASSESSSSIQNIASNLIVSSTSMPAKRKRAIEPISSLNQTFLAALEHSQPPPKSSRSGRLIRPRNLDL